jgi:hypothetical protein
MTVVAIVQSVVGIFRMVLVMVSSLFHEHMDVDHPDRA